MFVIGRFDTLLYVFLPLSLLMSASCGRSGASLVLGLVSSARLLLCVVTGCEGVLSCALRQSHIQKHDGRRTILFRLLLLLQTS